MMSAEISADWSILKRYFESTSPTFTSEKISRVRGIAIDGAKTGNPRCQIITTPDSPLQRHKSYSAELHNACEVQTYNRLSTTRGDPHADRIPQRRRREKVRLPTAPRRFDLSPRTR